MHNMMMVGPPGAGKTLLARAVPSILPPMTFEEALTTTKIYSVAGMLPRDTPLIRNRPFPRSTPHRQLRRPGRRRPGAPSRRDLAGPPWRPVPDELPEFGNRLLEMLRQPLEDGS